MKITLYKTAFDKTPAETTTFAEFINGIISGKWRRQVLALRAKKGSKQYDKAKGLLPAVTMSGEFVSRDSKVPVEKRIKKHSGLICLDVDHKDNELMRVRDIVDKDCLAQLVSCSGEGLKIVYKCTPTKNPAEHRRIYDAAVQRLEKAGVKLKVDPIVKSIASLQYVSFDPEAYYNPKSKVVIKPLPAPKVPKKKPSEDKSKDLEQLNAYIEALGSKDITKKYEDWLAIAFGLSYSLGETGREPFHTISKNYSGYSEEECNEMYDACMERDFKNIEKPVTIASAYQIINEALPKVTLRNLGKKYIREHTVGVGEDIEQGDLSGMVRYKLFLFKKILDKKTNSLIDLVPTHINLNAFETLLRLKGFFRYGKYFVHVVDNIVETVDVSDVMRIMTNHVEADGDYTFSYKGLEFKYSWEELAHLWRTIRSYATTRAQIADSLEHWKPNLLRDTADTSYIPYRNGVLTVTKEKIFLQPYKAIEMQIWKERILPREFSYSTKRGMFEEFFVNVSGRGKDEKQKIASEHYKRALWYYGYMLQGTKRQSTARAWVLYDIKSGNNGRTGKTILGQAIGRIRSVVTIDGKQVDFRNRFAFQTVEPWTDIVFIDDPSRFMSLQPLFNMITGELSADKKGLMPVIKGVKFLIASNWILEAEGNSEAGRQFVTQIDDFYVRWGKANNNTITPIVDYHGKEFFTDWDATDWNSFDSFSARALQFHLKAEAPQNSIIGNALMVRFIQLHEQELFFELATTFINNIKLGKDGSLLIPQQLLISVIKDHDTKNTSTKAGKLARDFLQAIGATQIDLTSIVVAGSTRMAYKVSNAWKELSFGEYSDKLPKPKGLD
jgi:hypothetical protein